jgi:hypothetical protein
MTQGILLGYIPADSRGVCHGFTLKWLEACLLGEEEQFTERLRTITSEYNLKEKIGTVKDKVKAGHKLTEVEEHYLDILAFYEGILLFQSPYEFPNLFNKNLNQMDYELVSPFASADKISALGGLAKVYSDVGIYTKKDLVNHLENLQKAINQTGYNSDNPVGFEVTSFNHAVGLTYDTKQNHWNFMDINKPEFPLNKNPLSTEQMAEQIFQAVDQAFPEEKKSLCVSLGITVISTAHDDSKFHLKTTIGILSISPGRTH